MPKQFVTFLGVDELKDGEREVFDLPNESILLLRVDGQYYAVENRCSHEEVELQDGVLLGCELECPKHSSSFDLRTGKPSSPPALSPIKTYPTRIHADEVQVEIFVQENQS